MSPARVAASTTVNSATLRQFRSSASLTVLWRAQSGAPKYSREAASMP